MSTRASASAPVDPLHGGHDAGARLVVRPRVDVDAGLGARVGAAAGLARDDGRLAEEGRVLGDGRELAGELAEGEVLGAVADQAEGRDVPERGGATVAEHDLVALGEVEVGGQPGADRLDEVLDRGLAVRGAEHRAADRGQGLDLLGADLRGPGAEPTVGGQQVGGDGDLGVAHEGVSGVVVGAGRQCGGPVRRAPRPSGGRVPTSSASARPASILTDAARMADMRSITWIVPGCVGGPPSGLSAPPRRASGWRSSRGRRFR